MTKQGNIVYLIKEECEVPYIVADIDDKGMCLLIKISSYGWALKQRIRVKDTDIKNNCFDDVDDWGVDYQFEELEKKLLDKGEKKINKWILKRQKETEREN